MPHLDDAHTLARYLVRSPQDAEDVVQDAFVRALTYFASFRGDNARAWLLTIVRNACYDWVRARRSDDVVFEDDLHSESDDVPPDIELLRKATREAVQHAVDALPFEFREVIVLREVQGLSYKEVTLATGVPIGTVMSRLARARRRLERMLRDLVRD